MAKKYDLVIFDLDGTLLNTSAGIFNSVRYAEQNMGLNPIANERLKEFVGPPPKSMYMKVYGLDEEKAFEAAKFHREYGRTKAIYEAVLYDGVLELLKGLKNSGYKLAVSTLKGQKIAEAVLENFEIAKYFDVIVGMDEKESLTKCMTIKLAMDYVNVSQKAVMIGDSQYDYDGATEAGIDFIGVTYGFGFDTSHNYPFKKSDNVYEIFDSVK